MAVAATVAATTTVIGLDQGRDPTPESVPGQVAPLTDDEVGRLFDRPLPGVTTRGAIPRATGNRSADRRIRDVAVQRGYVLRGEPIDPMGSYQGWLLQQRAIDDLVQLQAAMQAEVGVTLTLTSAQRSATRQRQLFLGQMTTSAFTLRGRSVTNSEIALGLADDVLHHAMALAAPPGFSRHHTGLVIDVKSEGLVLFAFSSSTAYAWLTENRYANALAYGWAPSYPPNASAQGPKPEPWEWSWVGRGTAQCALERSCAVGALERVRAIAFEGWAATPDRTAVSALRLRTAAGTEPVSTTTIARYDLAAALGLEDEQVGFVTDTGPPDGADWACIEARTRSGGPWNRVACRPLG